MVSNESFIKEEFFKNIDLEDKFFNTLKNDYNGFNHWFVKKADEEEKAFISKNEEGLLDGFLYLKDEFEQNYRNHNLSNGSNRVDKDVTSIEAISLLRGNDRSTNIENCKAILVSRKRYSRF